MASIFQTSFAHFPDGSTNGVCFQRGLSTFTKGINVPRQGGVRIFINAHFTAKPRHLLGGPGGMFFYFETPRRPILATSALKSNCSNCGKHDITPYLHISQFQLRSSPSLGEPPVWKTVNIYVITRFWAIFNVYFYANSTIFVSKYRKIIHLLKSIQENWLL